MCLFDKCFCGKTDCSQSGKCKKSLKWANDYVKRLNLQDIPIASRPGYPCDKYDGVKYKNAE